MFGKGKVSSSVVKQVLYDTELVIDEVLRCWLCGKVLQVFVFLKHKHTKESVQEAILFEPYNSLTSVVDRSHPSYARYTELHLCSKCYTRAVSYIQNYVEKINSKLKDLDKLNVASIDATTLANLEFEDIDDLIKFISSNARACSKFDIGWVYLKDKLEDVYAVRGRCILENVVKGMKPVAELYIPVNTILKKLKEKRA